MKMTAQELIKEYNIYLATEYVAGKEVVTGNLRIARGDIANRRGDISTIRDAKQEIIDILMAERDAAQKAIKDRADKINAIPSLTEILNAKQDLANWNHEFRASFDGECGGGVGVREKPNYDFAELLAKYPKANAYLQAKDFADSDNIAKSEAGQKALDAIINGDDYNAAIVTMEAEWSEYCTKHLWD